MAEQKMTDEQLSQELHKRNGGRAGGTLLSLLCGTMLFSLCSEGTTGTACSHEHTDDCYTEVLKCVHEHDDECGYSPATRGTPCEFAWDGKEK